MDAVGVALRAARVGDVTVSAGQDSSLTTRMADNIITQNVRQDGRWLSVTCAFGKKHGSVSTSDLSRDAIRGAVRRAEEIARVTRPDPEHMPPLGRAEMRKYVPSTSDVSATLAATAGQVARDLARAAREVGKMKLRLSGAMSAGGSVWAIGNSAGLRACHRSTNAEVHMTALGGDGSGWAQETSHDIADVNAGRAAAEAARIAVLARHPKDLAPGNYTVIMKPAAAAELLMFALWPFDAKAADEGHSYLRGKLGKKVFGSNFTVRSDHTDPRSPDSPFGGDGLARRPMHWVRNGVVENLVYSRFWAKKKRKAPTGWPPNHIVEGDGTSVDAMIASTEHGLLITRFWYVRYIDSMLPTATGMTRDGLFLIRNGRIAGPVRQMRFNVNTTGVLNSIEMTGTPERAWMVVPALKVRDFSFTSGTRF